MAAHAHSEADPPDAVGQVLSAVCAVHCVATPLLPAALTATGSLLGPVVEGLHPVLLVLVVGVALWAFVPAYRCHRSRLVVALAVAGIALLSVAIAFEDVPALDVGLSLAGATTMMAAHWKNRALLRAAH